MLVDPASVVPRCFPSCLGGGEQSGIQFVNRAHAWQEYREVALGVADQSLDLAFFVTFGRSAKPILKQVVTLQFGERLGARTPAITKNLGHGDPGAVVENRLRNAANPGKRSDVPIQKRFCRLSRVGFEEDGI